MKSLEVVAAVIEHQDKILCALKGQHNYAYLSNEKVETWKITISNDRHMVGLTLLKIQ